MLNLAFIKTVSNNNPRKQLRSCNINYSLSLVIGYQNLQYI